MLDAAKALAAALPYPRSFLGLLLTGFTLVMLPLVGAMAYSARTAISVHNWTARKGALTHSKRRECRERREVTANRTILKNRLPAIRVRTGILIRTPVRGCFATNGGPARARRPTPFFVLQLPPHQYRRRSPASYESAYSVCTMSALGHKRTFRSAITMSALPPKADIRSAKRHVRFVP